jgi:hypothetical protein
MRLQAYLGLIAVLSNGASSGLLYLFVNDYAGCVPLNAFAGRAPGSDVDI